MGIPGNWWFTGEWVHVSSALVFEGVTLHIRSGLSCRQLGRDSRGHCCTTATLLFSELIRTDRYLDQRAFDTMVEILRQVLTLTSLDQFGGAFAVPSESDY